MEDLTSTLVNDLQSNDYFVREIPQSKGGATFKEELHAQVPQLSYLDMDHLYWTYTFTF